MSAKAIREYDGRSLLVKYIPEEYPSQQQRIISLDSRLVLITPKTNLDTLPTDHPWLLTTPLVIKPDQLIKRRGKLGLVGLNLKWEQCIKWIHDHIDRDITIGPATGKLDHFVVSPYVAHSKSDEYYVCIQSDREGEVIMFKTGGGVDVGNVDETASRLHVDIDDDGLTVQRILDDGILDGVPDDRLESLASFVVALLRVYRRLHFAMLEINPLVQTDDDGQIHVVDLAAKLDETASFLCGADWGRIAFPPQFGRTTCPEEQFIRDLDSKTGASLKLTVLNEKARIWTMVAGGGASVVYADTICDLGFGHELANYGEYSGAPSTEDTYNYAKTVIGLMCKEKDPRGKIFIVGGGIANFTDVAATFTGLIKALKAFRDELLAHHVDIWIRRAGPNWQEGLRLMRECATETGLPIHIYGPETEMTAIVPLALGLDSIEDHREFDEEELLTDKKPPAGKSEHVAQLRRQTLIPPVADHETDQSVENFSASTRCIVYGLQKRAVQGMLDFDMLCKREVPSVAAMIFPFKANHFASFYFGSEEVMIPVYKNTVEAINKHPDVSVVINFASCRSVFSSVLDILKYSDQVKTIVIIAEGVPEQQTRFLIKAASKKGVAILGPATVGGIKTGCFRIGNAGGMMDNIIDSKLYRPGSVAYVTKSGGISNELNHIICRSSDGVYEGVAIGGDRYPGSRLVDQLIKYNSNDEVKILMALGEVGGKEEYAICEALESGKITKPLIAWCIGTCSTIFPYTIQFGHAGASASKDEETALAKNNALRAAGAHVPTNFGELGSVLRRIYDELVTTGALVPAPEPRVPKVPMDYAWAKKLGLVRKPRGFVTSISDERGEELLYAGMPISMIFEENMGLGAVICLLWCKRQLPEYASRFVEMVLMVTADHGPAVSGAHNTIIATRAGKDLVSSLASGLLTIGPRFGGALDEAAVVFTEASDSGTSPQDFVKQMRLSNRLIMGIGHKVKSLSNPDMRVEIIKKYALEKFPDNTVLRYALEVESITTRKKNNLILNVDGCIAVCVVDMLRSCGAFTKVEADELVQSGCLNGLFVLGRSIGLIGHHLDQKRLKQGLYRHPWDDISYLNEGMPRRPSGGGVGGGGDDGGVSGGDGKKVDDEEKKDDAC